MPTEGQLSVVRLRVNYDRNDLCLMCPGNCLTVDTEVYYW